MPASWGYKACLQADRSSLPSGIVEELDQGQEQETPCDVARQGSVRVGETTRPCARQMSNRGPETIRGCFGSRDRVAVVAFVALTASLLIIYR